jgi:hypothetical protein
MKTTCMQLCGRCRVCYRATRTKTYNSGLFTARKFRRPFEAVSWDFQNLGTSSDSGKCGLLTLLCEHTGFCELYATDAGDATAEFVADCLVQWSLRWGFPETAWGGQDVQMSGEVTCIAHSASLCAAGYQMYELYRLQQECHREAGTEAQASQLYVS